jgi:ribosomal protein L11 methyltransferase
MPVMPRAPYDQLHIYEITGDARAPAAALAKSDAGYLGLWLEGETSFLFFSRPADDAVAGVVAAGAGLSLRERHQLSYDQWQGGLALEPVHLQGLSVAPAWSDADEVQTPGGQPLLRLDPGVVFGNGLHPTTRHCLELLLLRAGQGPLGRVMDLGCGTGILACAAKLLGAEDVLAVDLNPLCVETTKRNADLNRLAMDVAEGQADEFMGCPTQVVLANMHWDALEGVFADPARMVGKNDLIISGITRSHLGALRARLGDLGYNESLSRQAESTWFSLWATRAGDNE